jgi:hypothetical protein
MAKTKVDKVEKKFPDTKYPPRKGGKATPKSGKK